MTFLLVVIAIFLFNIPFGYWRANVKKLSVQWLLSIHIPVPFIIVVRFTTDIGFAWTSYFFTISAFFLGQLVGKRIYKYLKAQKTLMVTSCIVMDVFKRINYAKSE